MFNSLILGIPIVSPQFLDNFIKCVQENAQQFPSVDDFMPPIANPLMITSDDVTKKLPDRQHLFNGKTFIFMTNERIQYLKSTIEYAGGKCVLLAKETDQKRLKEFYEDDHYISVQFTKAQNSTTLELPHMKSFQKEALKHGRRIISEFDIGMAILKCSTVKIFNADSSTQCEETKKPTKSHPIRKFLTKIICGKKMQLPGLDDSDLTSSMVQQQPEQSKKTEKRNRHSMYEIDDAKNPSFFKRLHSITQSMKRDPKRPKCKYI